MRENKTLFDTLADMRNTLDVDTVPVTEGVYAESTTMLFVTPGEGTENRESPQ